MLSLWLFCCVSYKVEVERKKGRVRKWDRLACGYLRPSHHSHISNDLMRPSSVSLSSSLSLFLFSTLAANFPCLAHISRLLLSNFIKDNVLKVLHSTALGLVKARREEGESKVGISLSLPVSKSSAIFLHWIISACSLYAQKYVEKSKIAEISLKMSFQGVYAMTFLVSGWSSAS